MPRLELVSHALCPYVQRAVIVLTEKGLPFTRTVVDLADKPAWFRALSPLGKVPLLKVDEHVLFESAVICDYLDEVFGPRLHPPAPLERARHRGWVELASALLNDIGRLYAAPDEGTFEARRVELRDRLAYVEGALGAGPFFAGAAFSLVDAAFAPAFRYFDVFDRFADLQLFDERPKLRAWREALSRRQSVQGAVAESYPQALRDFIVSRNSHMSRLAGAA
jgi:glutathione S-transferase